MHTTHHTRTTDQEYIQSVSRIAHTADNKGTALPDGCWDIVILRKQDSIAVFRTGLLTHAIPVQRSAGEELLTISFPANIFMPHMSASQLTNGIFLFPQINSHAVWVNGHAIELPSFDNVEGCVERLFRLGIVKTDRVVEASLKLPPTTSTRTLRRHFALHTGVTYDYFRQIVRAQRAVTFLHYGISPHTVAAETGYFDQAHMTKSLQRIMGQTPGEILKNGANTTKDLSMKRESIPI